MWNLEKLPSRGGILGSTATNTFEGHSFETEEDLLVRETVQNSKDVPCGKAKPKVVFRAVTLTGARKNAFLRAVELRTLYGKSELIAKTQSFSELRGIHSDRPLGLIYIEDFNTTGLDGPLDDPTSNWMRFNLHGDAAKLEEEGKIGSYGYGKAVLSRAAGTNTFLVYTAVNPKGDSSTARLMGHTFQPWFPDGHGYRSGRGWLCASVTGEADPIPYTNDVAHKLAEAAGFTVRKKGETGTSFLLIGNNPAKHLITIDAIRRAVETWWWPSILDNQLDVELWQDGRRVADPSPKLRSDLKPYIGCKAKLDTGIGDADETKFHREHGKQLGRLALALATDESIFDHPIHPKSPGPRRVARMRAASGMVTEYKDFGTQRRLPFVGIFCADLDADEVLKFSEPPEHDEWSRVSQRLARIKHGAELVKAIEDRTQAACLHFQRQHSAARAPLTDRLPELERLLGAAFDERDAGPKRRKKHKDYDRQGRVTVVDFPDSPNGRVTPVFGKTSNQLNFLIRYKLRPDTTTRAKILAAIRINVAEDAQCEKGEPLEVEVTDQALGRRVCRGVDPTFQFELTSQNARTFRIRTAPYARHQVVLFEETELRVPEAK
jgi:hypothetical protein